MIRTIGLTKNFGSLVAVDSLDLDVKQGELFAFLGPNAAGKTTTIKMLAGLLKPARGTVIVGGFDVQREPERAKAQMAYVPDFPFLYDKLTATEFVQFVGDIYSMERAAVARLRDELFDKLNLDDFAHELTENLSHGTKQRLVIASALLHDPRVFIIDEPMVGLDPLHARIVKDEFKERSRKGVTVFLSTHQLSVAEELADRVGIIDRGKLIALGTVEELRARSRDGGGLEQVFLSLVEGGEDARPESDDG